MHICKIPVLGLMAMVLFMPWTARAQTAPCQFVLGFRTLYQLIPAQSGACLDDQSYATNGDGQQLTARGLMVWRKADNWTAFTDGNETWLMGPYGLAKRLNTQRFPWEPDFGATGLASAPTEPAAAQFTGADRAAALALFPAQMAALAAGDGAAYGRTLAGHVDGPIDAALTQTLRQAGIKYSLDSEKLLSLQDGRALVQITVTTTGTAPNFRNNRTVSNNTVIREGGGWKELSTLVMKVEYI